MAKHKPEDPWAGFVDVLSNILMVIVFLVVILGMAIFALSQQITKQAVAEAVEEERAHPTKPDANSDGGEVTRWAPVLLPQNTTGIGERIVVPNTPTSTAAIDPPKATQQRAILTLAFSTGAFAIDADTRKRVESFLDENSLKTGSVIKIYGFARSTMGSVTEARRIAYYRAMETRTVLIDAGVSADNITVTVYDTEDGNDADTVRIFSGAAS